MSANDSRPIGVFDSGAGGLTVVRTLLDELPNERVVYFGDTAYVPYGPRPRAEIQRFAADATRFLCEQGAKLVVMGCNMSSAMALDEARDTASCPVLGTIGAGSRSAVQASRSGRIGVAATEGTVSSGAYKSAIEALNGEATVLQQPCPLLVPAVESGMLNGVLECAVEASLESLRSLEPDTLILGCTHYPLVAPQIAAFMGPGVALVDPAEALARQAAELLSDADMRATGPCTGRVSCHASGPAESLVVWSTQFLDIELGPVQQIDIHQS